MIDPSDFELSMVGYNAEVVARKANYRSDWEAAGRRAIYDKGRADALADVEALPAKWRDRAATHREAMRRCSELGDWDQCGKRQDFAEAYEELADDLRHALAQDGKEEP